jgi:hypothetical protein
MEIKVGDVFIHNLMPLGHTHSDVIEMLRRTQEAAGASMPK